MSDRREIHCRPSALEEAIAAIHHKRREARIRILFETQAASGPITSKRKLPLLRVILHDREDVIARFASWITSTGGQFSRSLEKVISPPPRKRSLPNAPATTNALPQPRQTPDGRLESATEDKLFGMVGSKLLHSNPLLTIIFLISFGQCMSPDDRVSVASSAL
ncbi:hypothetical protein CLAFUW4_09919 [Fulvia fulva]|uniref:uncharacterized protein n=1 Tax=Passalora fulva TaxID=5499 RepID=UPI0028525BBB|nr:uncharacterized protein CLAFUR5_20288 [Fulvia fulva]KAK4616761.1 hypothetical protein CLAFUR0_09918 [Fulvia fulva]WMI39032.1 hypothetical protein CLAFUR5_20288 [Fulvia fulva]WPV19496.1 hypothetical protein CLAFUW4_09919 [Fulvia fulva]